MEAKKSGGTTVNVGSGGEQFGKVGEGYRRVKNPDGTIEDIPIPGSKPDIEAKKRAKQEKSNNEVILAAAQTVFEDASRALDLAKEYGRLATGPSAMISSWLPITPAGKLEKHIESIKGNIGIYQLLKIKKYGAGLGHVTQSQLEILASLLGKFDSYMELNDFVYNVERIQEIYGNIIGNLGEDPVKLYNERKKRLGVSSPQATGLDAYWNK
jgi:hypothetical protein